MGWKLGGPGLHDVAAVQAYCDGSFVPATGAGGWDVRVVECLPRGLGEVLHEMGGRIGDADGSQGGGAAGIP